MLANNETGDLFPVEKIAGIVKERSGALMHVDGVNAAGKVPVDLSKGSIDLFSISAHKFHGPKGNWGALYSERRTPAIFAHRRRTGIRPMRAGTEAVHQIVGMGAAARARSRHVWQWTGSRLRDKLENEILTKVRDCVSQRNGRCRASSAQHVEHFIRKSKWRGDMARLNEAGICVSTGSACNAEDHTSSQVLQAMKCPTRRQWARSDFLWRDYKTEAEMTRCCGICPRSQRLCRFEPAHKNKERVPKGLIRTIGLCQAEPAG